MEEQLSNGTLHTGKLIEEMLEFLNSSSEIDEEQEEKEKGEKLNGDDEEFGKHLDSDSDNPQDEAASLSPASRVKNHKSRFKKQINNDEEELTDADEHSEEEYFREPLMYKDQHLYWFYGKDSKHLKQHYYSKWNSKDPSISNSLTSPIWKTFTKSYSLDGSNDTGTIEIFGDCFKWKLNGPRNNSIVYIQEVQKAIYSKSTGFPMSGSENYFKAAQNYATYGTDFLDFPINLLPLWYDTDTYPSKSRNGSGNYESSTSSPSSISSEESTQLGHNHFIKSSAASSTSNSTSTISTLAASNIVPTGLSTSEYCHLCTGSNPNPRTSAFNSATAAAAYSMFLGLASATHNTPTLLHNAHNSAPNANFLPNSLTNNAVALANVSPALFYSNPMLPNTTQHYLNVLFKETQYFSTNATNATNATNVYRTTFYERLVYAQKLQQIYHQTQQQAAAVAAILQKQRPSALPIAVRNITTNAVNNASTTISPPIAKPNCAVTNPCNRQKVMPPSAISPDIVLLKNHSKRPVPKSLKGNNSDDTNNGIKE